MQQPNRNDWNVRFEVTFYGNDPNEGSFREIREDNISSKYHAITTMW